MHPVALNLGSWPIHWYGVLVAVGFLAGLWTAGRRAARSGFTSEQISDAGPWLMLGTVLGARTLYVTSYWPEKFAGGPWWEIFMIQKGGLVFYGGLIGASLATIVYCRARKMPLWRFADVLAPSIALGYVFGRLGCFMNGCCYGQACALPWAVTYPRGANDTFPVHAEHGTPVHPTQIYDSLLSLGLYLFLAWLYRRKKFDGQVFATYLICYAFTRAFVEHFRGDYTDAHLSAGWITPAQLISAGILVAGLGLMVVLRGRRHSKYQIPNAK